MAGFGNAKQLMVDIDFDVSGMKSMSKLSEAIQNGTENLEALEKELKNATESQENLADATGFSTSQLRAQARAMGKLNALDAAGRSQTAKTEQLSARASDIQNITAEADRLRESQQKIQEFEQVLGQQGLSMDEEGNIKDGNRRLENRGEILQQVMAGQQNLEEQRKRQERMKRGRQQMQNIPDRRGFANNQMQQALSQGSMMDSQAVTAATEQADQVLSKQKQLESSSRDIASAMREREQARQRTRRGMAMNRQQLQGLTAFANSEFMMMQERRQSQADSLVSSMKDRNEAAGDTNKQFAEQFGLGMNLMFMGMALQQVFGGLSKKMMKTTGASSALGAGLKSMLLPFFIAITPLIVQLSMAMTQLPKPIKMAAGALTALLAVLGVFLFFGMQVFLLSLELSVGFAALAGSILAASAALFAIFAIIAGVYMIFKEFGPVVGALAAVVGGVLIASIVSAVASLSVFQTVLSGTAIAAYAEAASNYASIAAKYALAAASSVASAAMAGLTAITSAATVAFTSLNFSMTSVLFIIGSLILGLLLLQRVFNKFGPVVGLLATIIMGALFTAISAVAAAAVTLFGAFKAVNMVFKRFGKIIGAIFAAVVIIIGAVIAAFASVPVGIGLAIGAALAVIWNFRDEIMSWYGMVIQFFKDVAAGVAYQFKLIGKAIGDFIDWVLSIPGKISSVVSTATSAAANLANKLINKFTGLKDDALDALGNILDWFSNLGQTIVDKTSGLASKVAQVGKDIIDGIIDGIENNVSGITDAFKENLPGWAMKGLKTASGAIENTANTVGDIAEGGVDFFTPNDFILTDGGKMIQPAAGDTIIGTKNPEALGGGGGGKVEIQINDPVMKEEADIERLVDEVEDRVNRDTRGRTGGI